MPARTVRMTVEIPEDLLPEVDAIVREGRVDDRSDFFAKAALTALAAWRREAIDAEIALMAQDTDYQEEATRIAREMAAADWEALRAGEESL